MLTLDELADILKDITYLDWLIVAGIMGDGFFVQIRFNAPDSLKGGHESIWSGRKWYVSRHSTKDEVVQTCLKAVLTANEHEAREAFTYRGVAIFQPHTPVDELVQVAKAKVLRA